MRRGRTHTLINSVHSGKIVHVFEIDVDFDDLFPAAATRFEYVC